MIGKMIKLKNLLFLEKVHLKVVARSLPRIAKSKQLLPHCG
jgi:hypothetical protein